MKTHKQSTVNLAATDTIPLPLIMNGKKRPYYGGGRDRLSKTDKSVRLAAKITLRDKKNYDEAVDRYHPDKGPCLVLRALVEAYVGGAISIARRDFKVNGLKFPPGAGRTLINTLVPSDCKEMFERTVTIRNPGAESADIVRELARLYALGQYTELVVPDAGHL
jgi:hypothetical protein